MQCQNFPLISVVIPSFNHAQYLGRALQSLLNQKYENWEAIIVDNSSTDNTDEVLAKFCDHRIIVFKIKNNGIIASSRNLGIKVAKGEWIAFLDSDDWWKNSKLQVCVEHFKQDIDFIYHGLEIKSSKPRLGLRKKINSRQLKSPVLIDLLLHGNVIGNSSVVIRKELLNRVGGINECKEMISAEDYNTWLRISCLTNRFKYIPDRLGYYFFHDHGISRMDTSGAYLAAINEFFDCLSVSQNRAIRCNASFISGRHYYFQNKFKIAHQKFINALPGSGCQLRLRAIIFLVLIFYKGMLSRLNSSLEEL